jgi:NAD(P)H-hydrate epimerase
MKVLTAAEMREVDRRTIEMGIPGLVLMENAGHRVVELLAAKFAPLARRRIVVFCGPGNNGGDGFVVARQLHTRFRPRALWVVCAAAEESLKGDAAANFRMLGVCGCPVYREIIAAMRHADIVVDALLGTGLGGPARGAALDLIREINTGFPEARVVAVDVPSGLASDTGEVVGEAVRADFTVTFTAPKPVHVLPPACDLAGELSVGAIGSPAEWFEEDEAIRLALSGPEVFRHLLAPRDRDGHKGAYGHVLVIGGSAGKTGAAAMAGMGALRAGAGLVTVASAGSAVPIIGTHAPELMTEALAETETGSISPKAFDYGRLESVIAGKTVVALGPGLGTHPETVAVARRLVAECRQPLVLDADGLNAVAGTGFPGRPSLILTPHPGEMARLARLEREEILKDRVGVARRFATEHGVTLVLKGRRTLVAMPGGLVWVNPTGTAGMATGGTGDILTGMIAGLAAHRRAWRGGARRAGAGGDRSARASARRHRGLRACTGRALSRRPSNWVSDWPAVSTRVRSSS